MKITDTVRRANVLLLLPVLFLCFSLISQPAEARQQQAYAGLDTLQLRTIFAEPYLPGVRPGLMGFSPIGNHVHFTWNDSSYIQTSQYRVDLTGALVERVDDEMTHVANSVVSPNRQLIAYTRDRALHIAGLDGSSPRAVFSARGVGGRPHWSSDSRRVAFTNGGELWTIHLENGEVAQHTNRGDGEPNFFIRGWAAGDSVIVVQQTDTSHYQEILFPEYVPEFVQAGASRRGQPNITLSAVNLRSNEISLIYEGEAYVLNTAISPDGRYFVYDVTDHDMKERSIISYDFSVEGGANTTIHSETTEGWIYGPLLRVAFAPESNMLFFTSEQSGFSHIYTARGDGSRLAQITSGDFEVDWVDWIGSNTLAFSSTQQDPGLRDLYTVNINTRSRTQLTRTPAFRWGWQVSPDNRHITYLKTSWNKPADVYLIDIRRPDEEVQLTQTVPERFNEIDWQKPEYYRIPNRDDQLISMDVLKPHDFDPSQQYPVVVFAHGAGSLQNVFQGWSRSYPREYMFHQLLNRSGYVVVEVDFRHSTGYGRKFREDVTNWMGDPELRDIIDGLDYLDENYGYLDLDRVGIYGGSYGGFMALYAVTHAPDRFHAAAALRAVTNWRNYFHANPGYTRPRLGTPDENPEHYDRSSPITYANELLRPVIILHGLIDDNVGFQDAAQYINILIESGNTDFDMMMYPSERHGFQNPEAWHDQYLRFYNFFDRHIMNAESD
ncbi:Dipeptidyl aminopeptidase/acylaminoacyl peptidase [Cyclonatronum proteinivorum]|uniref:Dipeptidyl aminopeptidase/acylaminoacyl peptidase n=1 Tax=Cyclonatronum proteinivorum TaxID=1457365 RepID=A0A345UHD8_9BACT|nr:S9 family peptidase [Cyclonatronum proteinivorum]AXI99889.1 Dipeptidyl aminopeptidase/acylaminoacyl peptidase [Cyclonatronum proteinivorum]